MEAGAVTRPAGESARRDAPTFDIRAALYRMTGVDLNRIPRISEGGGDMTKWRTEGHFVSWLRLCPDNKIRGDKVIGKGRLPTNNRLTVAFKMAASTLWESRTHLGRAVPTIADMAAKLARLVYRMLRFGM